MPEPRGPLKRRRPTQEPGGRLRRRHSPSAADTEALRPTQTCQFRHTDLTLLSQRWDLFPSLSGSPARAAPRSDTEAPRPTQVPPSDTAPPRPTTATALGAGRHGTWRDTALGAGRLAHPAAADTPTPPADSPRPTQTLSRDAVAGRRDHSIKNDQVRHLKPQFLRTAGNPDCSSTSFQSGGQGSYYGDLCTLVALLEVEPIQMLGSTFTNLQDTFQSF
ncbi:unnamed protein product [Cladocopium goreaui]|uniref:Uncharacterized protein n=1 Tax=Cladocopium goreaui TaxID=2562237 RepID=A0A9P1DNW2_9DINO|nr:unnamed protein product [Cladocopium goreaui]